MDRAPSPTRRPPGVARTLFRDERGATAIEYALIIALIVVAMIGALSSVAGTTSNMWNRVSQQVLTHG